MHSVIQELHDAVASAYAGLTPQQLERRLEGKWCIAEVLEHLYLTYKGTTRGLERCLEQGKPMARVPTLQDRVKATVVTGLGYMPSGREAPKHATPRGMKVHEVMDSIGQALAAMDAAITRTEETFGERTCILDHPFLGPLTARQWRKFHLVHGRHHVKQIRHLRAVI